MKTAICLQPYIPIRATASEAAEMVNQLIFGDTFRILEEQPRWYRIIRDYDDYEGWIDWKTATLLSEQDYMHYSMQASHALLLRQPYNVISRSTEGQSVSLYLSWGSRIYNLDDMGISFRMQGVRYDVPNMTYINPVNVSSMSRTACAKYLLQQAQMLVNVPYLWGGCTAFGIDCSGLVQICARLSGLLLPRDASQQVACGDLVYFLQETCAGDLAFFGDEDGRITHVGILMGDEQIIHASGQVRIDYLDQTGIFNKELNVHTHRLQAIKRMG